jgi:hypothetical protein
MNTLQQVAMSWLDRGIASLPISYRSKRPNFSALTKTGDIDENGRPTWERMKTELPSESDLVLWYGSGISNIGIVTGHQNLVVVDFDNCHAFDLWMATYGSRYASTYKVTSGRGWHLYYYIEDMPVYTMSWIGGEIKCSGYVLAPPSIHPSGKPYRAASSDVDIMTISSIYDILPESVFFKQEEFGPCIVAKHDVWNPAIQGQGNGYFNAKQEVSILSLFPTARHTGNGWYSVSCPFHNDNHNSGWINTNKNRYGCYACVNGSLSVVDVYMRLHSCDLETAVNQLRNL